LTISANTGASLNFGAAGATVAGAVVAVGPTGAEVGGVVGAGVGVAAVLQAERIVDRIKIQATAIMRVVLDLVAFIILLLLDKRGSLLGNEFPFWTNP
jgi:hypothetical protein